VQEDRSIGSGISSALNYSESNFSMSFQRRAFDVPSKDSSSVNNSIGEMVRYSSAKRID
jgi:hypothetical protein